MALALGKLNFSCAVIGLTFINHACRQRTGTPKFRGSGCQFPQSQCHPSPRTGIALGTRLIRKRKKLPECSASTTACSKILLQSPKFLFSHKVSLPPKRWKKSRKFRQFETNVSWTLREIEYHYIA